MSKEVDNDEEVIDTDAETKQNVKLDCKTFMSILKRSFSLVFYLFSVYFFEYVIITSFADVMGHKVKKHYPHQQD